MVGGRNSANTRELTRLVGIGGGTAIQVQDAADLADASVFEGAASSASRAAPARRSRTWRRSPRASSSSAARPTRAANAEGARAPGHHAGRRAGLPQHVDRSRGTHRVGPAGRAPGRRRVADQPDVAQTRRAQDRPARRSGPAHRGAAHRGHGRPPERRQEHALQPRRRRAAGHRGGPRPHHARPPLRRGRVERPPLRGRGHRRAGAAPRRPDRGEGPGAGPHRHHRGGRDRLRGRRGERARRRPTRRRPRSCAPPKPRCWSPPTRPTTRSASWRPPSSTASAGRRPTPSARSTAAAWRTCWTPSSGRCRPESESEIERKRLEAEADELAELQAEGIEPLQGADGGAATTPTAEGARIAIVGRPNVGKSSLLNKLLGEERTIVSEIPGTTRDAIDTSLEWNGVPVRLVDTAGIRRRGKVAAGPAAERFSTLRAVRAVGRADVAVLVLDAVDGLTAQDAHVAGYVVEEGTGLVIAINKWDLVEKDGTHLRRVRGARPPRGAVPGLRADRGHQRQERPAGRPRPGRRDGDRRRAPQARLHRRAEPRPGRRRVRPSAAAGQGPPAALLLRHAGRHRAADVRALRQRRAGSVHFSYKRYLENRLREAFGFGGTPMRLIFRERSRVELEPRRQARPRPAKAVRARGRRRQGSRQGRRSQGRHADPRQAVTAGQGAQNGARSVPIAVVGAGTWGTTLALHLARSGPVTLLARDEEQAQRHWRRTARTPATCPASPSRKRSW